LIKIKAINSEIRVVQRRYIKKNFDSESSDNADHRIAVKKCKNNFFFCFLKYAKNIYLGK